MHLFVSKRTIVHCALGASLLAGAVLAASCAKGSATGPGIFSNGPTGTDTSLGTSVGTSVGISLDGSIGITSATCAAGLCSDFASACSLLDDAGTCTPPAQSGSPVIVQDPSWPAGVNPSQVFGNPGSSVQSGSGGPCLYEPAPGALFPNNWLRPRFIWTAPAGETLFELHFHTQAESSDLFVYVAANSTSPENKWTMPKDLWTNLATDVQDTLITVGIRGASSGGSPSAGSETTFAIAPAPAQGSMVFWSTESFLSNATTTNLQGFAVGDETTVTVLTPTEVTQTVLASNPDGGNLSTAPQPVTCIGCHAATPDGLYVGFTAQWPWPNVLATVSPDAGTPVGAPPPWLGVGAAQDLNPNIGNQQTPNGFYLGGSAVDTPTNLTATANNVDNVMLGIQTFSPAHYQTGDRIEIASLGASLDDPDNTAGQPEGTQASGVVSELIWINLEFPTANDAGRPNAAPAAPSNGGWGVLARTGDSNSAGSPNWSHDGKTVAYTSSNQGTMDGRLDQPKPGTNAVVMTIPYSAMTPGPGGAGGTATPVPGASSSSLNQYFPSWSPDDQFLAFDAVPAADTMYDQPAAELFIVPSPQNTATVSCAGGGAPPCKLAANAPAACSGLTTPGVQNTWPKWAPAPAGGVVLPSPVDGNTYYWVTFSSIRIADPNSPAAVGSAQMDGGGPKGKVQLYMAGISVSGSGVITTYPAIYLWNQDPTQNNLIPAWDNFTLPPASGGIPR